MQNNLGIFVYFFLITLLLVKWGDSVVHAFPPSLALHFIDSCVPSCYEFSLETQVYGLTECQTLSSFDYFAPFVCISLI